MKKTRNIFRVLLITILSSLLWCCSKRAENEIHLLPKDFNGIVVIRFNAESGKEKRYDDNNQIRVYEIPANGILDTKFDKNDGLSDPPEFYYLDGDKRISIGKNKMYSMQVGVSTSDITGKDVTYESYILSDEKHVDSLYTVRERMNIADAK